MSESESGGSDRAEARIAKLIETNAALKARLESLEGEAEKAKTTDQAKAIDALNARLDKLTKERDAAKAEVAAKQSAWETERVMLAQGVSAESDIAALRALHGVYGGKTTLAEWLGDAEKLPAAAKALLPAKGEGEGTQQTQQTQTQTTGGANGAPREQGGGGPKPGAARTIADLARLTPAQLVAESTQLGTAAGGKPDLRAGFEALVRSTSASKSGA